MSFTDPIGDMLTRIRNASSARHEKVLVPASKLKVAHRRGPEGGGLHPGLRRPRGRSHQGAITILLKYGPDREPAISDIKRVSRSRACAATCRPATSPASSTAWASPSSPPRKGVMVDREARKQKVGGELICTVW